MPLNERRKDGMSVRFAPSPTGRFHVGNLRTAWISREWARRLGVPWVVRFEDIDQPRHAPGALEGQLADMKSIGLVPDRVLLQSERLDRHRNVFLSFQKSGWVYPCFCSRKDVRKTVAQSSSAPHAPVPAYSGRCRDLHFDSATNLPTLAWRIRCDDPSGRDDFVIARTGTALDVHRRPDMASFTPAYHWACAIDDYDGDGHGDYTLLVRAWDLEPAAAQQRAIGERLARLESSRKSATAIFHASLVTAEDGGRLEKRTKGVTLPELFQSDETQESLKNKFEDSFTGDWNGFAPGRLFGEIKKTLRLSDLMGRK